MIEVLTLEGLKLYDKLLKEYIDGNDGQSLKSVEMIGNTLYISRFPDDVDKENIEQEN